MNTFQSDPHRCLLYMWPGHENNLKLNPIVPYHPVTIFIQLSESSIQTLFFLYMRYNQLVCIHLHKLGEIFDSLTCTTGPFNGPYVQ